VPVDCLHATCKKDNLFGGCGGQFCFLCGAPWGPIILHGNWYHYKECDFYNAICCEKQCIQKGGKRCSESKPSLGQAACRECAAKRIPCTHYCTQCLHSHRNGGKKVCVIPGHPSPEEEEQEVLSEEEGGKDEDKDDDVHHMVPQYVHKVWSLEQVRSEERRLNPVCLSIKKEKKEKREKKRKHHEV